MFLIFLITFHIWFKCVCVYATRKFCYIVYEQTESFITEMQIRRLSKTYFGMQMRKFGIHYRYALQTFVFP